MNPRWSLVGVLLLLGCEGLPVLELDSCGNGVIDDGEDCDRFADETLGTSNGPLECTLQCKYACTPVLEVDFVEPEDRRGCPDGAFCDVSGECRFPAGSFVLGPILAFAADTLQLGDFDGDYIPDLLGGTETELELRYGNGDGTFSELRSLRVDVPSGPREVIDLQRTFDTDPLDARIDDIVLPLTGGLAVMEGDTAREIIPRAFSSIPLGALPDGVSSTGQIVSLDFRQLNSSAIPIGLVKVDNDLVVGISTSQINEQAFVVEDVGPGPIAARIPTTYLRDEDEVQTAAIAFEGGSEVYLVTARLNEACDPMRIPPCGPDELSLETGEPIDLNRLGPLTRVAGGSLFADLDSDGLQDLLVGLRGPAPDRPRLAWARGSATQPSGFEPIAFLEFTCNGVRPNETGCTGLPLAVGDIGDLSDPTNMGSDLVYPEGVFVADTLGGGGGDTRQYRLVYDHRGQPWTQAELVDLNLDGRLDVVALADINPVLDLLANTDEDVFNRFAVPIGSPADRFRVGDFDGDIYPDIALVQPFGLVQSGLLPNPEDTLETISSVSILYAEGPSNITDPILMGRFEGLLSMEVGSLRSNIPGNDDAIDDLIVLSVNDDQLGLALMEGTGQRRLHALLALGNEFPSPVPALVRSGYFGDNDVELVTFAACGPGCTALYLIENPQDDDLAIGEQEPLEVDLSCLNLPPNSVGCINAWVGTLGDNPLQQSVVAVNRGSQCPREILSATVSIGIIDIDADNRQATCRPLNMDIVGAANLGGNVQLELTDIDNDGQQDIMAFFSGLARSRLQPAKNAGMAVWSGARLDANPTLIEIPQSFGAPYTFEIVNIDTDPLPEVALLAESGVFLLDPQDDGLAFDPLPLIPQTIPNSQVARSLTRADIDFDGLEDLLIGTENRLYLYFAERQFLGDSFLEDSDGRSSE